VVEDLSDDTAQIFQTLKNVMEYPERERTRPVYVPKDLDTCKYVFVRNDNVTTKKSIRYFGPYLVLSRDGKTITILKEDREDVVSKDRVKPMRGNLMTGRGSDDDRGTYRSGTDGRGPWNLTSPRKTASQATQDGRLHTLLTKLRFRRKGCVATSVSKGESTILDKLISYKTYENDKTIIRDPKLVCTDIFKYRTQFKIYNHDKESLLMSESQEIQIRSETVGLAAEEDQRPEGNEEQFVSKDVAYALMARIRELKRIAAPRLPDTAPAPQPAQHVLRIG